MSLARDGLAAYRLARLAVTDEITKPPREALIGWTLERDHRRLRYLLTCPHCAGIYAAAAVLVLGRFRAGRAARDLLAVAGVVSALNDLFEAV